MKKYFLKEKIEAGFEEERELLDHGDEKKKLSILSYVRPIYFLILIIATLAALGMNGFTAIKFFITH